MDGVGKRTPITYLTPSDSGVKKIYNPIESMLTYGMDNSNGAVHLRSSNRRNRTSVQGRFTSPKIS